MNNRSLAGAAILAGLCLALGAAGKASSQSTSPSTVQKKEVPMAKRASGAFDVKMTPQAANEGDDSNLGRMTLDKQFHGDLEATGKGQMLAAMTEVQGSAGYVAMERVSGTLGGRKGTFVLQHNGIMNRGEPQAVDHRGAGLRHGATGRSLR